eukprot:NODE_721_length_4486_cov_1.005015.p1 type:complete len:547 gc:universal NODE_721_length_4486_cov_1.005015:3973-2333(-)
METKKKERPKSRFIQELESKEDVLIDEKYGLLIGQYEKERKRSAFFYKQIGSLETKLEKFKKLHHYLNDALQVQEQKNESLLIKLEEQELKSTELIKQLDLASSELSDMKSMSLTSNSDLQSHKDELLVSRSQLSSIQKKLEDAEKNHQNEIQLLRSESTSVVREFKAREDDLKLSHNSEIESFMKIITEKETQIYELVNNTQKTCETVDREVQADGVEMSHQETFTDFPKLSHKESFTDYSEPIDKETFTETFTSEMETMTDFVETNGNSVVRIKSEDLSSPDPNLFKDDKILVETNSIEVQTDPIGLSFEGKRESIASSVEMSDSSSPTSSVRNGTNVVNSVAKDVLSEPFSESDSEPLNIDILLSKIKDTDNATSNEAMRQVRRMISHSEEEYGHLEQLLLINQEQLQVSIENANDLSNQLEAAKDLTSETTKADTEFNDTSTVSDNSLDQIRQEYISAVNKYKASSQLKPIENALDDLASCLSQLIFKCKYSTNDSQSIAATHLNQLSIQMKELRDDLLMKDVEIRSLRNINDKLRDLLKKQ